MTKHMTEDEILFRQKELDTLIETWETRFKEARGEREWWCKDCEKEHRFKDLIVYRTQHYVRPYSCNGGDYWVINDDELYWQCTECHTINRMLFHSQRNSTTLENHSSCKDFMKRYWQVFKDVKTINEQFSESKGFEFENNYFMGEWDNFKYYVPDFEEPWEGGIVKFKVSPKFQRAMQERVSEIYNITSPEPKLIFLEDIAE